MQTFVTIWAERLQPLATAVVAWMPRVAEEGVKSAAHLLGMLVRALDYLPPVDLEFADVIDAVVTADKRLAPEDDHGYRTALERSFAKFGIVAPRPRPHRRHRWDSRSAGVVDGGRRSRALRAPQLRCPADLAGGGLPVHLEQRRGRWASTSGS